MPDSIFTITRIIKICLKLLIPFMFSQVTLAVMVQPDDPPDAQSTSSHGGFGTGTGTDAPPSVGSGSTGDSRPSSSTPSGAVGSSPDSAPDYSKTPSSGGGSGSGGSASSGSSTAGTASSGSGSKGNGANNGLGSGDNDTDYTDMMSRGSDSGIASFSDHVSKKPLNDIGRSGYSKENATVSATGILGSLVDRSTRSTYTYHAKQTSKRSGVIEQSSEKSHPSESYIRFKRTSSKTITQKRSGKATVQRESIIEGTSKDSQLKSQQQAFDRAKKAAKDKAKTTAGKLADKAVERKSKELRGKVKKEASLAARQAYEDFFRAVRVSAKKNTNNKRIKPHVKIRKSTSQEKLFKVSEDRLKNLELLDEFGSNSKRVLRKLEAIGGLVGNGIHPGMLDLEEAAGLALINPQYGGILAKSIDFANAETSSYHKILSQLDLEVFGSIPYLARTAEIGIQGAPFFVLDAADFKDLMGVLGEDRGKVVAGISLMMPITSGPIKIEVPVGVLHADSLAEAGSALIMHEGFHIAMSHADNLVHYYDYRQKTANNSLEEFRYKEKKQVLENALNYVRSKKFDFPEIEGILGSVDMKKYLQGEELVNQVFTGPLISALLSTGILPGTNKDKNAHKQLEASLDEFVLEYMGLPSFSLLSEESNLVKDFEIKRSLMGIAQKIGAALVAPLVTDKKLGKSMSQIEDALVESFGAKEIKRTRKLGLDESELSKTLREEAIKTIGKLLMQ